MTTEHPDLAPAILIREALSSPDINPEKLRALLEVRQLWEESEARKAFNFAISDFQRRAPIIEKGDDANGKAYAAIDRIWRTVRPLITELGLSVTWQVCELRGEAAAPICHVEGMLRHRDGHGEKLTYDLPIPAAITSNSTGRAVQNDAQRMGSAHSYAKRYALCGALGIVTGQDDDGNGGVMEFIDAKERKEICDLIDACRGIDNFNEDVFWRFVAVPVLADGSHDLSKLPASRLADVLAMLKRKLGKMKP